MLQILCRRQSQYSCTHANVKPIWFLEDKLMVLSSISIFPIQNSLPIHGIVWENILQLLFSPCGEKQVGIRANVLTSSRTIQGTGLSLHCILVLKKCAPALDCSRTKMIKLSPRSLQYHKETLEGSRAPWLTLASIRAQNCTEIEWTSA